MDYADEDAIRRRQFSLSFDRVEAFYLTILRVAVLVMATILLVVAIGWLVTSLYKISRSADSVVEQPAIVAVTDILPEKNNALANDKAAAGAPKNTPEQERFYRGALSRYHALYQTKYQSFQRPEDKKLTRGEFDDLTLSTTGRLSAIRDGELDFETDKADVDAFLKVVEDASARNETTGVLASYRKAQKRPVTEQVTRTRRETRRGWNMYSTSCEAWYESPIGCPETRSVDVPYTQSVTTMQYPAELVSPIATLKSAQDRYFRLLNERRESNAADAQADRENILLGHVTGRQGLTTTLIILGGFLLLLFFFLLVAIERHQRRLSEKLELNS